MEKAGNQGPAHGEISNRALRSLAFGRKAPKDSGPGATSPSAARVGSLVGLGARLARKGITVMNRSKAETGCDGRGEIRHTARVRPLSQTSYGTSTLQRRPAPHMWGGCMQPRFREAVATCRVSGDHLPPGKPDTRRSQRLPPRVELHPPSSSDLYPYVWRGGGIEVSSCVDESGSASKTQDMRSGFEKAHSCEAGRGEPVGRAPQRSEERRSWAARLVRGGARGDDPQIKQMMILRSGEHLGWRHRCVATPRRPAVSLGSRRSAGCRLLDTFSFWIGQSGPR